MKSAEAVKDIEKEARSAAGGIASATLAQHFAKFAANHRKSSQLWSALTIVSLLAVAAIAALVLFLGNDSDASPWAELLHLALTLPFAAMAGWASQVAGRHRDQWAWAAATEAQLMTAPLYAEALNDPQSRSDLLTQFGQRMLSAPVTRTPSESETASLLAGLQSVIVELGEKNRD
ncbi:hypothetical protein [Gordonia sp. SL306]|uniref:hypothetical protein n=1 Tax=Gordonia sp. SL306 TaxID=2995145 RepID=UPI00226E64DB|nr:hypothetical protein [Gordonia sp. SL306]WAC55565.1 hypothetical protein OVA31_23795 [Gordonia sp. SL306]